MRKPLWRGAPLAAKAAVLIASTALMAALVILGQIMFASVDSKEIQVAAAPAAAATSVEASLALSPADGDGPILSSRGGRRSWAAATTPVARSATATSTEIPTSNPNRTPYQARTPTVAPSPIATSTPTRVPAALLRVGIQIGHWKNSELPAELASLRGSTGAAGSGWKEMDVNLDIGKRAAAILEQQDISVELIPATVPIRYKAAAFVALHCDANSNTAATGYKLARASWSPDKPRDDALLNAISAEYAGATGLRNHPATITTNMTAYYAFNRGLQHSVDASTPAVILEMGFLTTLSDRNLLMEQPDRVAQGVANGILKYLGKR